MSKSGWALCVSLFVGVGIQFVPVPEAWRWTITIVATIGLAVSAVGWFLTRTDSSSTGQNLRVGNSNAGNFASAGRDVHQTIYHAPPSTTPHAERELPDFFYDGGGSQVIIRAFIPPGKNYSMAAIHFKLRFENGGNATAYNLTEETYGCWIHDEQPRAILIDTAKSVGRTPPGQGKSIELRADRDWESRTGMHTLNTHKDCLTILVDISFRSGSSDGPIHKNEPIWLTWTPAVRDRMTEANEADVLVAKPLIDDLKKARSTTTTAL